MSKLLQQIVVLCLVSTFASQKQHSSYAESVKNDPAGRQDGPTVFPPQVAPGVFSLQTSDYSLNGSNIVGGSVASEAPEWMVFPENPLDEGCAGTLVSEDTVVTAAHCYDDCIDVFFNCSEPCPTRVRIGSTTRNSGGLVVDVLPYSCILHPQFASQPNRYDVATYKLAEPVSLSKYAIIQANPSFPSYSYSGEAGNFNNFRVYGFGRFSNSANNGSERLRVLYTTYWHDCDEYFGGVGVYEASHHICTWNDNGDESLCQGDFGGPLIYTENNGEDFLVGIASFLGSGNEETPCATGAMDFFSRVGTYADWIVVCKVACWFYCQDDVLSAQHLTFEL